MAGDSEDETYSIIFSSLRHPIRRKIFRLLYEGPKTFTEILNQVDVDSSNLSYHLDSLKELVKKDNGRYSLSDFGCATTYLMLKVEEPEKKGAILRSWQRIHPKLLFVIMFAVVVVSVAASIYYQSLNTQIFSTFAETRYHFAGEFVDSIIGLSGMHTSSGWGPPVWFWTQRDQYSNISILDTSYRQISFHAQRGRIAVQQLIRVDSENRAYYERIDGFFSDLQNLTNSISRLIGENKTSAAQAFMERLYDKTQDYPTQIGADFLNAYSYLNRVDPYSLQLACEGTDWLRSRIKPIVDAAYLE